MRLFRPTLLCCLILGLGNPLSAAERRYDYQKKVLKNGLTVLSLEDHSCPVVAVQVWYHVGSKDEDPNRQGFAHMFEHMMFRGTDKLGPEEHFSFIRGSGGECNAYTAFDNTTYVNELPSNQLELALWLEAERMTFLRIDDESFFKERAVVEEERRLRSLNTPYGTVPEKLLGGLFKVHPYRWTPIGSIPHLRAATIDELQAFWDKYYVPANATLVVVGDVKHAEVHSLAEKYFGWIPASPAPPRVTVKEPPQTKSGKLVIPEKKGPVPIIGYVYRGVPESHPDSLPLEMLMSVVGGGESSRIYKELVKDKKLAQAAVAGAISFEDDGLLGAGAILLPAIGDQKKVFKAIEENLERVTREPVTARELDKVRNQLLRQEVEQAQTVASKAQLLGQYETLRGGAEKANRRYDEIRAVTPDDLLRVAKKYLTKEHRTRVSIEPQFGSMLGRLVGGKDDDVDEGAAPPKKPTENRVAKRGAPRTDLKRPDGYPEKPPMQKVLDAFPEAATVERKLDNGLRVIVIPNHEVPFVSLTLGLLNGAWTEEHTGTAAMAASLITKGSAHHTAAEMAEELEFNAISLNGSAGKDVGSVYASCVSDKFDLTVKLMAEVTRTPTFPKDEFEVLRKQQLLGLMISTRTPEYVAEREMRQRLYGLHPYSRTPIGEIDDVQGMKLEHVAAWWKTFVRPDSAVLYIAGDVKADAAIDAARKAFGDWKADGPRPQPKLAAIPQPGKTTIYLVDRPGSVQSQIRVGHLGITRTDPLYFDSRVLSQILGGGFNSRLNKAIRVEKGLTYGARGGLSADRFAGSFSISTFTKTPSTLETLQTILKEIDRIQSSPPEQKEVDETRSFLLGSFARERETPASVVADRWVIEYAGLPQDYFKQYLDRVRKTSGDDVLKAAGKLIHPDQLTIVVVGEAEKLKTQLESIAPVQVVKPEDAAAKMQGAKPADDKGEGKGGEKGDDQSGDKDDE